MNWQKLYNPIMIALLRSPLHGFVSSSIMLITFTGRKSGRTYTTPVNYLRDGDTLLLSSSRERVWWKNLRGGAPVTVRVQGQDMKGMGEAFTDNETVTEGLLTLLQQIPIYQKVFKIELTPNGQPVDAERFSQSAQTYAIIRITNLEAV